MPKHFFSSGTGIKDCPEHRLNCKNPSLIDCPKRAGEMIEPRDLESSIRDMHTEALLIRTGFYRHRSADIEAYCNNNPFFSPNAARWIRENLLNLNMIGIDIISISSKAHKSMGIEAHKILLTDQDFKGAPVYILEDLYLPAEFKKIDELFVFPIFSADIDSSPCSVIGVIYG